MKLKSLFSGLCVLACLIACDTETDTIGTSIISNLDHLEISTDTFTVTTRSIVADSVLSRSAESYLGTIRDPETDEYISANYMTQFHVLENYGFPKLDSIVSRDDNGYIIADSCEVRLFCDSFYGDSATSMKCTIHELSTPMSEANNYYSNFDPIEGGLIRKPSDGGLKVSKTYSIEDMNVALSTRNNSSKYTKNVRILLDKPYTDKDGNTYGNTTKDKYGFGTYLLRKYYKEYGGDSTYFKNSTLFAKHVLPGFYVESTGGLGSLMKMQVTQMNVYFRYYGSKDSIISGMMSFVGTEEVMQHTNYVNESGKIKSLAEDSTCTYLKTPAGIFTEVTLPVEEICLNHDNDTINSAKFTLQRLNDKESSDYNFDAPTTVMLIPRDSLYSFFENKNVTNNKTSYTTTLDATKNTYTFDNISTLIRTMYKSKLNGTATENWNKAVIIPVVSTTNSSYEVCKITHDMSLTSTRLVGGPNNPYGDIKMSVIYSKFK